MSKICYAKAMPRLVHRTIGLWPMPKLLAIFALAFFFLAVSLFIPSKSLATPQEFVKAVQEGNNLQWYLGGAQGMLATTADSLLVAITGVHDEQGNLISSGALQTTSLLMASLYHQPISSAEYLAYVLDRSGLAKSAYAQGSGWDFLTKSSVITDASVSPPATSQRPVILELWTVSRNITYLFFILIFVAVGFMIMFRSKLNPQTIVNIQLALPSIIVSLILVTFSFAISGLIIDFVFLGHRLIESLFFNPINPLQKPLAALINSGQTYFSTVGSLDIVSALLYPTDPTAGIVSPWAGVNVFNEFGNFLEKFAEKIGQLLTGSQANFFSSLVPLIFAFTLLGTALKIFFGLLTKYVTLILSTFFSPFVFLFSAFPGRSEGIGNFLKTMLSAALTFPATGFMFFLSAYFVHKGIGLELQGLPPLNKTGILGPGATIGIDRVFEPLIALGILMATTQVPQAIDQALGVKPGITSAATPEVSGALRKIPIIGSLLG